MRVILKKEGDDSYDILIEAGIIGEIPGELRADPLGDRYAVVTDSNVMGLLGRTLIDDMRDEGLDVCFMEIPFGEESKNLSVVECLTRKMIREGLDRRSVIIALGGGVVGDVAGLTASIYMRGIPYIQVPTTLVAQVDSSVGGKTAVNLPEGKNLVGSFHQPERVYIDPAALSSLPQRHMMSGVAEVVKYGVIYDAQFFEYLEKNLGGDKTLEGEPLTYILFKSCQIKSEIVQRDEKEENLRSILNYGHTVGHALEKFGGYKALLHGEAVSIGMSYAGKLAVKLGFFDWEGLERQNRLLESLGLPLQSDHDVSDLVEAMRHDKKVEGGRIRFVLPERIGRMFAVDGDYKIPVSEEDLVSVMLGHS